MLGIKEQIKEIIALGSYINACHKSRKAAFISAEIERRQEILQHEERFPRVKLGWLVLTFQIEKENETLIHQTHEAQEYTYLKITQYDTIAREFLRRGMQAVPGDEGHHPKSILDKQSLPKLIERQKSIILQQSLAFVTLRFLESYTHFDTPFSTDDVLAQAFGDYRQTMYQEAFCQFELIRLVERLAFLTQKKAAEEKNMTVNYRNIRYSIDPEIEFINKALSKIRPGDFNLQGTRDLFFELVNPSELTRENLVKNLSDALKTHGESNISPELLDVKVSGCNSDIKCRPVKVYFNEGFIPYMMQFATEIEQLERHVRDPLLSMGSKLVLTDDNKLLQLRAAVEEYKQSLPSIEAKEQRFFAKRSPKVLQERLHALTVLELCINLASTLTPGAMGVVVTLVNNINAHTPRWKELHPFKRSLDVMSLGVNAVVRHGLFKPHPSAVNLHGAIADTPSKGCT